MIGGVTRLGGLPGLLGGVTRSAWVAFCHVNDSRWGTLARRATSPSWGPPPPCKQALSFNLYLWKTLTLLFRLLLCILISPVFSVTRFKIDKKKSKLVSRLHIFWLLYCRITSGFLSKLLCSCRLLSPAWFSI